MYTYKLKEEYSGNGEVTVIGVGVTKNGVIASDTKIESQLFELQTQQPAVQPAPQTVVPEPIKETE